MLTLTEELLLLSLREKKKKVVLHHSSTLPFALAGAMLVELVLSGLVQIEKDKMVVPVNLIPTETAIDSCQDELLSQIRSSGSPRKIRHWIAEAATKGKKLERQLLASLISRGVLKKEEKITLWVIPYTEYTQIDASAKYVRKRALRDIIFGGATPDQQSVALFSLLKAIGHLDFIFTLDEIKAARGQVNEIVKDEAIGDSVIEMLNIIAFAAASTSSSLP